MKGLNMMLPQLDLRCPWLWPRAYQYAVWLSSGVLGVVLISPWWFNSWQAWNAANEAKVQLLAKLETTQALRAQTAQLLHSASQGQATWADASVLSQLAQQQGLQLSQVGLDKPQHSPAMAALHMQQLPVHLNVQGSWENWLNWLAQWPTAAPGVTVSSLELKADARGGIAAQVLAIAPQLTAAEPALELAGVKREGSVSADPFSAQAWAQAQRVYAQQHPSYVRWVAPEFLRPRDMLEAFPRERLLYVGQISSMGELEALVKVLPHADAKKDAALMRVHRVRVGQHLGQDFGKVLAIASEQLVVQELALSPSGEWQPREVRMLLQEAAP